MRDQPIPVMPWTLMAGQTLISKDMGLFDLEEPGYAPLRDLTMNQVLDVLRQRNGTLIERAHGRAVPRPRPLRYWEPWAEVKVTPAGWVQLWVCGVHIQSGYGQPAKDQCDKLASKINANALGVTPCAPAGWRLVPVTPTPEMRDAAVQAICYGLEGGFTRTAGPDKAWKAMLDAAPAYGVAASDETNGKRSTSAATASGHELLNGTAAAQAAAFLSVANGGDARVASAGRPPAPAFTVDNPCACGAYGGPESHARWCRYAAGVRASQAPSSGISPAEAARSLWEDRHDTTNPDELWQAIADTVLAAAGVAACVCDNGHRPTNSDCPVNANGPTFGVAIPPDLGREVRHILSQVEHAGIKLGNAQRASDREGMRQWRDVLSACKVELDTLLPPGVPVVDPLAALRDQHAAGIGVLAVAVEALRERGSYTDEEGEATNALADLLDALDASGVKGNANG